ncbi:MAG: glycosyl hydrolase [Eubacteriales bacterium]
MTEFLCSLKNPSEEYRGHPFWSWNDKLVPDELRRQIRSMKAAGLGGFFMHARGGLETEYMSDDWFGCVSACVDEAKKEHMEAWAYDEDGWPSGFAGGEVTALGDEYHVRYIECHKIDCQAAKADAQSVLASLPGTLCGIYTVSASGHYRYFEKSLAEAVDFCSDGGSIYAVCHDSNPYYVDLLNPKVVRAFIDSTYEKYADKLGSDFGGKTMPGFFTDEPQLANRGVPWSYILPEEFGKTHGYDPTPSLICLFYDVLGAEKFRYDFWSVVSRLYTESFGKQIYDWCGAHNCRFTGHAMAEDNLASQMRFTGGVMPLYEYMHVPGVDWLGRHIASPIIPKQVGSAAAQCGRRHVLTESFALTGWDVSLAELKWIAEWQFLNGVNLVCAHLEGYTIRGLRKRDYPCTIFEQSPWWDDYKIFNDYISRLGKLLADGNEIAGTLLLHPMRSAWISSGEKLASLDRDFERTARMLSGMHVGYHFGDETIIHNLGHIDGGRFIIGEREYTRVILPSLETLSEETYALLVEFASHGGKIFSAGTLPYRINGRYDSRLKALNDVIIPLPSDPELADGIITSENMKLCSICGDGGEDADINVTARTFDDGRNTAYFAANLDREHSHRVTMAIKTDYPVTGYRLETLKAYTPDSRREDGVEYISLELAPMQSVIILTGDDIPDVMQREYDALPLKLGKKWEIDAAKSELNALTLDYAAYALGTLTEKENGRGVEITFGDFGDAKPVLGIMDELLAARANVPLRLRYTFEVSEDFDTGREMYLVCEYARGWRIEVNGREVRHDLVSWWRDRSFKKINITGLCRAGHNEITVTGAFAQKQKVYDVLFGENVLETERNKLTFDTEIESMYLLGDFGVRSEAPYTRGARRALFTDGGFTVGPRSLTLTHGELVTQGYPFFSGNITLKQNVFIDRITSHVKLSLPRPNACAVRVHINGVLADTLVWDAYETDVTRFIREGDNEIALELIIGNRNLFGPHHNPQGESYSVTTTSFGPNGNYSPDSWRSRYCFVTTGI